MTLLILFTLQDLISKIQSNTKLKCIDLHFICSCYEVRSISSTVYPHNPLQLLAMPRSPTSSEDEMARSFSDDSSGAASDTSREETIYETIKATAEPPRSSADDGHADSLVVRVLIPDLQQTVRTVWGA